MYGRQISGADLPNRANDPIYAYYTAVKIIKQENFGIERKKILRKAEV